MIKIPYMIIQILFFVLIISLNCSAFNSNDMKALINKKIQYLEKCPLQNPMYENTQKMIAALRSISYIGEPKIVTFSGEPALYMIAVFNKQKKLVDVLYVNYKTHAPLSWPTEIIEDHRTRTFSIASWKEYSTENENFLPSYFAAPQKTLNAQPILYPCIEGDINRRLLGLPFSEKFRKKAFIIADIEKFFKNMHETSEQISLLNKKYNISLKPVSGKRNTPFKCFFYSAAHIADWWNIVQGGAHAPEYENLFSGLVEYGLDPRKLEALYVHYSEKEPHRFSFINTLLFRDAVTGEALAKDLRSVCELLSKTGSWKLKDPLIPEKKYTIHSKNFGMQAPYIKITDTALGKEQQIIAALKKYGPLLAGLVHTYNGMPLNIPTHAVVLCGYVETFLGTLFVYKEPYGDFPASHGSQEDGDVGFRMISAEHIFQVYAFAHTVTPTIKKHDSYVTIQFKNWRNIPQKIQELSVYDCGYLKVPWYEKNNTYYLPLNNTFDLPIKIRYSCLYYGEGMCEYPE